MWRRSLFTLVLGALLTLALPALAESEGGYQTCSADGHVYTKNYHLGNWYSWIDATADGQREAYESGQDLYFYTATYTYAPDWVNSGYYQMWADADLDTAWSWPGCIAD